MTQAISEFDAAWEDLCYRVAIGKLKLPDDTPLPTPADIGGVLYEAIKDPIGRRENPAWVSKMAREYKKRIRQLVDRLVEAGGAEREIEINGYPYGYTIPAVEGDDPIDDRLTEGFILLHLVMAGMETRAADDPDGGEAALTQMLIAGLEAVQRLWECVDTQDLKHPLAALIEGWLEREQFKREASTRVRVLTAGEDNLTRIPNNAKTAALATWEEMPDAVVIEVDGQPVSTRLQYPRRARPKRREAGELMPLPGTGQAGDLRLALLHDLEQYAGIDRRNPLPGDTLSLLTFGAAITGPARLHADQLGAMLAGQFDPAGATPAKRERWRNRAWAAVRWASSWQKLPNGHWRQLLGITTADLADGYLRVYPFRWDQHGKGYRLTGVLTNQATRQDKRGSLGRLAAGIEDYIAAAPTPARDRRSRLLIPDKRGGPGPASELIPYPVLMARAGFYFDLTAERDRDATKKLWQRLCAQLKERGYLLPKISAEAEAGDTFEIVEIVKGRPGPGTNLGGVRIRASARFIEAQSKVNWRQGDRGLTAIPLPRLFD